MTKANSLNLAALEGRTFILGRQGHILITSSAASRQHAEIIIRKGQIYLRDLASKNGLYLNKGGKRIRFRAGNVSLLTRIMIGTDTYMIQDLLTIAHQFVNIDDNTTLVPRLRNTGS